MNLDLSEDTEKSIRIIESIGTIKIKNNLMEDKLLKLIKKWRKITIHMDKRWRDGMGKDDNLRMIVCERFILIDELEKLYNNNKLSNTNILQCISKFDNTETLENKGRYFETIQKDVINFLKKSGGKNF